MEERLIVLVLERETKGEESYGLIRALPLAWRTVYVTVATELEVENGGFEQYFENSIGQSALEAIEAYRLLKASRCEATLARAVERFKEVAPDQTLFPHRKRWSWKRPFEQDPALDALSDQFFTAFAKDATSDLRRSWIDLHPAEFASLR